MSVTGSNGRPECVHGSVVGFCPQCRESVFDYLVGLSMGKIATRMAGGMLHADLRVYVEESMQRISARIMRDLEQEPRE